MTLEPQAAVATIRRHTALRPASGLILGSGLGGLADAIMDAVAIPFHRIPGFACSTACGHRGQLIIGRLGGVPVVAMAGRLHRYEGWSTDQVTFPVRVMAALGIRQLIVSSAAGAVNPKYRIGDIVVIRDHIDLMHGPRQQRFPAHPVAAASSTTLHGQPLRGPSPYDEAMSEAALAAARRGNFIAHCGTYLATLGPNYETRAEYRMMRRLGADVVGMSTVPEVLQGSRCGLRVLALSMVSNVASPDAATKADHQEVLCAGAAAVPHMRRIVQGVLAPLPLDAACETPAHQWREPREPAMLPGAAVPQSAPLR